MKQKIAVLLVACVLSTNFYAVSYGANFSDINNVPWPGAVTYINTVSGHYHAYRGLYHPLRLDRAHAQHSAKGQKLPDLCGHEHHVGLYPSSGDTAGYQKVWSSGCELGGILHQPFCGSIPVRRYIFQPAGFQGIQLDFRLPLRQGLSQYQALCKIRAGDRDQSGQNAERTGGSRSGSDRGKSKSRTGSPDGSSGSGKSREKRINPREFYIAL